MDRPVILIVEDERNLADLFALWLGEEYSVHIAYGGEEALAQLDDSVDVVLLDRRMPGMAGDVVLEEIRERDLDCRTAMVSAVEPDFDIIDMGFDDYLTKPVSSDELRETVDRLIARSTYDEQMREYFALISKKAVLQAEKSADDLEASDEYARLKQEIADVHDELEEPFSDFSEADPHAVLRDPPQTNPN